MNIEARIQEWPSSAERRAMLRMKNIIETNKEINYLDLIIKAEIKGIGQYSKIKKPFQDLVAPEIIYDDGTKKWLLKQA